MQKKRLYFSLVFLITVLTFLFIVENPFNTLRLSVQNSDKSMNSSVENFGVSAAHPLAVKVGMDIIEKGGNAVDAAVAVSYALGVLEPYGSGIGGGGIMLVFPGNKSKPIAYDYRETFPYSGKSPVKGVGVPGFVKGMELVNKEYGTMKISELIKPAITLAEKGFKVGEKLNTRLKNSKYKLPIEKLDHLYPNGRPIETGSKLKQSDLATTLKLIKNNGSEDFYEGTIAKKIVEKVDGLNLSDLKIYSPLKREPAQGKFEGYDVFSSPPPASGVTLVQSLQMAELTDIEKSKNDSAEYIHLTGEILKQAYQDRLVKIGDPDYYQIDLDKLTSLSYSTDLRSKITLGRTSSDLSDSDSPADFANHSNTTHLVIVDKQGMMVSATNTLSNFFGSGIYINGFFLNNQLLNFNNNPKSPNYSQPGKRPRSYLTPTILSKDGKPIIGIGSPGGKRIPMAITQVLIRLLKFGYDVQSAVEDPRFYIEGNKIFLETGFPSDVMHQLRKKGYTPISYDAPEFYGSIQILIVDHKKGKISGGSDPRRDGAWESKL